eukprot:s151_g45.t1
MGYWDTHLLNPAYPAVVRRAFSLECRGSLPVHDDPLAQLLGVAKAPQGSWYASCVLQRHRQALADFLSQALPAGAPGFLLSLKSISHIFENLLRLYETPFGSSVSKSTATKMWRFHWCLAVLLYPAMAAICGNWNETDCSSNNDGGCDCAWDNGSCIRTTQCNGVGITGVDENSTTTAPATSVGNMGFTAGPSCFGAAVWLVRLCLTGTENFWP